MENFVVGKNGHVDIGKLESPPKVSYAQLQAHIVFNEGIMNNLLEALFFCGVIAKDHRSGVGVHD